MKDEPNYACLWPVAAKIDLILGELFAHAAKCM
ncbi:hypothetical protein PsW64_03197 [Pseudovibrio sp. W64]|nr:hypothetical protein PsW64_03197 [Pseudovibrio sp. W64]